MATEEQVELARRAVEDLDVFQVGNGLFEMLWVQKYLSALVWDMDSPENMQIGYAAFVLNGEIHELADKVGFKIWKDTPELTDDQLADIADEFADIMAFLGQLMVMVCNRTGLTPADFAEAYRNKSERNLKRFLGTSGEAGYSGVANGNVR